MKCYIIAKTYAFFWFVQPLVKCIKLYLKSNFVPYVRPRVILFVLYCISLQRFCLSAIQCYLITIASCRAEILSLWGGVVRKQMCQIWGQQNNPQWYLLKLPSGIPYWIGWMVMFLPVPFVLSHILAHFLPDPTTS